MLPLPKKRWRSTEKKESPTYTFQLQRVSRYSQNCDNSGSSRLITLPPRTTMKTSKFRLANVVKTQRDKRVSPQSGITAQFGENSIAIPATGIRGPIFRVKDGRQGRETGPWVVRTDTSVATWKWISPRLPRPLLFKDEAYDSSPLLFSPSRPLSFPARDSRVENASSAKTPFARKDADNRNELLCIEIGEKEGRNVRNIF